MAFLAAFVALAGYAIAWYALALAGADALADAVAFTGVAGAVAIAIAGSKSKSRAKPLDAGRSAAARIDPKRATLRVPRTGPREPRGTETPPGADDVQAGDDQGTQPPDR